jgi:hypothetical protein
MKTARAALLALLASCAPAGFASFPVEVEAQMNGLEIAVQASSAIPLVVTFVSREKADARCKAEVASGLDTPQSRSVTAKAGKSTTVSFSLRSAPNRVRVQASCERAAVKSGG